MNIRNEFWVIIPARSGSKSIKNKNLSKISGKPLFAYSILAAKKNKVFKKIVFSSDSEKYLKIAKKYGNCILHKRSKKASSDTAGELDVLKDFIKSHLKLNKFLPKFFVSFRPTSPIRYEKTINKGIKLFKKNANTYSALRSVNEMSETSYKTVRIVDKKLSSLCGKDFRIDKYDMCRAKYPKTYEMNGIIDIYKTQNILKGTLLGNKVFPYVVDDINSNIDSLKDIDFVKYYIKKNNFKI
jgi:CMP-N,N'-diacetyllegionaminic acid synthase|tara:strand:- start:338 stop:1060 length:723 start_codon:yes stop_codon:yes gene_type:complete